MPFSVINIDDSDDRVELGLQRIFFMVVYWNN